jgi:hypothetical protein
MESMLHRPMPLGHNFHSVSRWDLTRKALNLPFEDLSFANFADSKVNALILEFTQRMLDDDVYLSYSIPSS